MSTRLFLNPKVRRYNFFIIVNILVYILKIIVYLKFIREISNI